MSEKMKTGLQLWDALKRVSENPGSEIKRRCWQNWYQIDDCPAVDLKDDDFQWRPAPKPAEKWRKVGDGERLEAYRDGKVIRSPDGKEFRRKKLGEHQCSNDGVEWFSTQSPTFHYFTCGGEVLEDE